MCSSIELDAASWDAVRCEASRCNVVDALAACLEDERAGSDP